MRRFWAVFSFELRRQGTRKGYLFTTFGLPLIAIVLLLGYQVIQSLNTGAESESEEQQEFPELENGAIGYVDFSGLFAESGTYDEWLVHFDSEADAEAALNAGDIQTYYVIPENYMEDGQVTRYVPHFGLSSIISDNFFRAFVLASLLDNTNEDISVRLRDPLNMEEHRLVVNGGENGGSEIATEDAQDEGAAYILVYLYSFLLLLGLFGTSGYLMQSVVEEKENRMVEILLSTVRPRVLLAGKVLSLGLLGLSQILVWGVAAVFLLNRLGTTFPDLGSIGVEASTMVWLVAYFVIGYLFFAALFAAIGAIAPSMREGPQLAVFVSLPAALPFYFTAFIAFSPNAPLPVILSMIPLTAPLTMVQRLAVTNVPIGELLLSLGLLLLGAVGAVWLAGRIFRVNTLLAGQMPKLRDLVRIVREG